MLTEGDGGRLKGSNWDEIELTEQSLDYSLTRQFRKKSTHKTKHLKDRI